MRRIRGMKLGEVLVLITVNYKTSMPFTLFSLTIILLVIRRGLTLTDVPIWVGIAPCGSEF